MTIGAAYGVFNKEAMKHGIISGVRIESWNQRVQQTLKYVKRKFQTGKSTVFKIEKSMTRFNSKLSTLEKRIN